MARKQSKDRFSLNLTPEVAMEFVRIPMGEYYRGSKGKYPDEEPVHLVKIQEFWLGVTPVTQEQFAVCDLSEIQHHQNHFEGSGLLPAESMTWFQAMEYCQWLNERLPKSLTRQGYHASLPSEAQWEYACRAGSETQFYSGNGAKSLERVGWYGMNAKNRTHDVGGKEANRFGLHDMHGNVFEWCLDAFKEDAYQECLPDTTDPLVGSNKSSVRVLRGGSYWGDPDRCRSAFRLGGRPDNWDWFGGFRVALVPSPEKNFL